VDEMFQNVGNPKQSYQWLHTVAQKKSRKTHPDLREFRCGLFYSFIFGSTFKISKTTPHAHPGYGVLQQINPPER